VTKTSSPRWTTDIRLTFGRMPDRTALFGAQPRGRGPMPRSSRRWAAGPQEPPRLPRRGPRFGFPLNGVNNYEKGLLGKRSASGRRG